MTARLVIAHLKCGHTVGPIPQPPPRKDGWHSAVHCPACRRKRETIRVDYIVQIAADVSQVEAAFERRRAALDRRNAA